MHTERKVPEVPELPALEKMCIRDDPGTGRHPDDSELVRYRTLLDYLWERRRTNTSTTLEVYTTRQRWGSLYKYLEAA